MPRLPKLIPVFWLFVKIFIGIMFFLVAVIALNMAQVYFSLFALLSNTSIDINSRNIGVLVLASSIIRAKIIFG